MYLAKEGCNLRGMNEGSSEGRMSFIRLRVEVWVLQDSGLRDPKLWLWPETLNKGGLGFPVRKCNGVIIIA